MRIHFHAHLLGIGAAHDNVLHAFSVSVHTIFLSAAHLYIDDLKKPTDKRKKNWKNEISKPQKCINAM